MGEKMTTKIGFLLGSGISLFAKLPDTRTITNLVISGNGVIRHTDGCYYNPGNSAEYYLPSYVDCCVSLIELIKKKFTNLNSRKVDMNYEDIYFIIDQIENSLLGEFENPIADHFLEGIKNEIAQILEEHPSEIINERDSRWLLSEVKNYIHDVVWRLLSQTSDQFEYLENIVESCLDVDIEKVDIFTLNHDLLMESFLGKQKIDYDIGFGPSYFDVRYWDPTILEESKKKVRLIKLHGSINWFTFPPNKFSSRNYSIGMIENREIDPWHTLDPDGNPQYSSGGRPEILVGTYNKMLHYINEVYADLHCLFRKSLCEIDHLIVCGYGFGDKGINSQVNSWMYLPSFNHMTIIHPNPDNLRKDARGLITKNWESWEREGQLTIIKKQIEHTSWVDIKRSLMNECQESS
jgi:hypothetical protein